MASTSLTNCHIIFIVKIIPIFIIADLLVQLQTFKSVQNAHTKHLKTRWMNITHVYIRMNNVFCKRRISSVHKHPQSVSG